MNSIQPNIDFGAAAAAQISRPGTQDFRADSARAESAPFADALNAAYREQDAARADDARRDARRIDEARQDERRAEARGDKERVADDGSRNEVAESEPVDDEGRVADADTGGERAKPADDAGRKVARDGGDEAEGTEVAEALEDGESAAAELAASAAPTSAPAPDAAEEEAAAVTDGIAAAETVSEASVGAEVAAGTEPSRHRATPSDSSSGKNSPGEKAADVAAADSDGAASANAEDGRLAARVEAARRPRAEDVASAYGAEPPVRAEGASQLVRGVSVLDLRTERPRAERKDGVRRPSDVKNARPAKGAAVREAAGRRGVRTDLRVQQAESAAARQGEDGQQLTMELSARAGAEQNITASSSQAAAATGSDFQQMLSNAVQQNAPELVRAGSIVLRDGNSGTINLILKPESLGNVKISLSLSDKVVSGQITVASREAMEAFRENIEAIRQAFTESGFDTGSFDLNFSGQQQEFAQGGGDDGSSSQARSARAERSYGDYVSSEGQSSTAERGGSDGHSVSIVA